MIVLTGSRGFIGGHVEKALKDKGHELLNFDRKPSPDCFPCESLLGWLDLGEQLPDCSRRPSDVEAIIHLGAITDTRFLDWKELYKYNTDFSVGLWRWCSVNKRPLIYASSAATYGGGEHGFSDSHSSTEFLRPLSPYAKSKHLFDLYALEKEGFVYPPRWYGLKLFNVYGPGEQDKGAMASMAFQGMRQISSDGEIRLFKGGDDVPDGGHERDFIHVDDVVEVILFFLGNLNGIESGLYNVGTGTSRSFNDLALALFKALGREPRIRYVDMPQELAAQYQSRTRADTRKLRGAGYNNEFIALEDGIRRLFRS